MLFIIPPYILSKTKYTQRSFLTMPYGVLSIVTYLKYRYTKIFDCNLYDNYINHLPKTLQSLNPDIVGISLMFDVSYKHVGDIIKLVKNFSRDITIVIGGTAATPNYKQILNDHPDIDAVCYGDGEFPVAEYLSTGKFSKGWATRDREPERNPTTDLDACIDINYASIDLDRYQEEIEEAYSPYMRGKNGKRQFTVITSRGCPYSCTFCMNSLNPDKTIRYASVDAIINHVGKLTSLYDMNVLTFYDDQILHDHDRAIELFTRLKPFNLRIEMPNGVTIASIDDEIARTMREAGVDTLYIALESGSPEVLKLMHKPVNLDKAREVVRILRKYDFFIFCFLVIGLPEETDEHRKQTIDFIREIKPDLISPKPASPVYGSALRQQCIEMGYIEDKPLGAYEMADSVIKSEINDPGDILVKAMLMNYRTNFVENYRVSIGDYRAAKHYFRYVATKYPDEIFAHLYYAITLWLENNNGERGKLEYFGDDIELGFIANECSPGNSLLS
jgi:anaerobic magnesium-protoporphyrin IX monomethyl ester cyclase